MAQAFNLQIQPTLKTKDMKIINGIAAFIENSDIIRYELEKRALRAAREVAPDRSGGLKKAIEVSNSTPTGFTLGVSNNISSGKAAVQRTETTTEWTRTVSIRDKDYPRDMRPRRIKKPDPFLPLKPIKLRKVWGPWKYGLYYEEDENYQDENDLFARKSPEQYEKEMEEYRKAVADENERVQKARQQFYLKKTKKTTSFQKGKYYKEFRDGGGKVRANMQEFGYPYKTYYWGPYRPNPNAPKGPQGKGYLRLGQVLAAKSLTKDSVNYSVSVTDQEVIHYEKTVETELIKTYTKLLAKFLRKQKLPGYFKNIDTLKQKAPIPERALAYGNVTNINLDLPLQFPSNDYSFLEDNGKLAGIRYSLRDKRPFEPGFSFLIDE